MALGQWQADRFDRADKFDRADRLDRVWIKKSEVARQ